MSSSVSIKSLPSSTSPRSKNVVSSGIEGAFSELSLDSSHGEVSSLADVNRERRSYESMRREIKGMPR